MPAWVKNAIDVWRAAAPITEGRIFRSIGKGGRLQGGTLAEVGVWWLVKEYAEGIGLKNLAPHDLRRTGSAAVAAPRGSLERRVRFRADTLRISRPRRNTTILRWMGGDPSVKSISAVPLQSPLTV